MLDDDSLPSVFSNTPTSAGFRLGVKLKMEQIKLSIKEMNFFYDELTKRSNIADTVSLIFWLGSVLTKKEKN